MNDHEVTTGDPPRVALLRGRASFRVAEPGDRPLWQLDQRWPPHWRVMGCVRKVVQAPPWFHNGLIEALSSMDIGIMVGYLILLAFVFN